MNQTELERKVARADKIVNRIVAVIVMIDIVIYVAQIYILMR